MKKTTHTSTKTKKLKRPSFLKEFKANTYLQAALIILAGALIASGILFIKRPAPATVKSSLSFKDVKPVAECQKTATFKCYNDYFVAYTNEKDPVTAFAALKKIYDTDGYAKSQCHQIAHSIGHAAYDRYKSLGKTYTKGDSFCWSGYYHGATERAIAELGPDKIKQSANDVCAELASKNRYSFDHFNCVHGLGHGFMAVANYNLFESLKDCDLLKDSWDRESCYGGAFMENVMVAARGNGTSDYLKKDELMYPCTAVETTYKQQCYLMQTSYALQQNGYDFADAFRLCRDVADSAYTLTCYQSAGRDASGSTVSDVERTIANCKTALDHTGLENCMLGAVRDFVSYYHSDVKAKELCATFGGDLVEPCNREVVIYYKSF